MTLNHSEIEAAMAGAGVSQAGNGEWTARVGWCQQVGHGKTADDALASLRRKVERLVARRGGK
jgi:hypothetical protein